MNSETSMRDTPGQPRSVLVLFDVDGTLVPPRGVRFTFLYLSTAYDEQSQRMSADMKRLVKDLRRYVEVGFIGGSTLRKALWQLGDSGMCQNVSLALCHP